MIIKLQVKSNYGHEAIYPACETSKKFIELTGKKTLSRADIAIIKKLGYAVEVITPTL